MWWPLDKAWYAAEVRSRDAATNAFTVYYFEDCEEETLDFANERVKVYVPNDDYAVPTIHGLKPRRVRVRLGEKEGFYEPGAFAAPSAFRTKTPTTSRRPFCAPISRKRSDPRERRATMETIDSRRPSRRARAHAHRSIFSKPRRAVGRRRRRRRVLRRLQRRHARRERPRRRARVATREDTRVQRTERRTRGGGRARRRDDGSESRAMVTALLATNETASRGERRERGRKNRRQKRRCTVDATADAPRARCRSHCSVTRAGATEKRARVPPVPHTRARRVVVSRARVHRARDIVSSRRRPPLASSTGPGRRARHRRHEKPLDWDARSSRVARASARRPSSRPRARTIPNVRFLVRRRLARGASENRTARSMGTVGGTGPPCVTNRTGTPIRRTSSPTICDRRRAMEDAEKTGGAVVGVRGTKVQREHAQRAHAQRIDGGRRGGGRRVFVGGILLPNYRSRGLQRLKWSRSSRTDKGVSSLCTVVSLRAEIDPAAWDATSRRARGERDFTVFTGRCRVFRRV